MLSQQKLMAAEIDGPHAGRGRGMETSGLNGAVEGAIDLPNYRHQNVSWSGGTLDPECRKRTTTIAIPTIWRKFCAVTSGRNQS